jgi:hypothetical protein
VGEVKGTELVVLVSVWLLRNVGDSGKLELWIFG